LKNEDCQLTIRFPLVNQQSSIINVERAMGFEPTTFSLARRRSTTEPRPQVASAVQAESAESQDRTGDTAIFSRVLYQLSYLGLGCPNKSGQILHVEGWIVKQCPE
jgi:hypothetical protein